MGIEESVSLAFIFKTKSTQEQLSSTESFWF